MRDTQQELVRRSHGASIYKVFLGGEHHVLDIRGDPLSWLFYIAKRGFDYEHLFSLKSTLAFHT